MVNIRMPSTALLLSLLAAAGVPSCRTFRPAAASNAQQHRRTSGLFGITDHAGQQRRPLPQHVIALHAHRDDRRATRRLLIRLDTKQWAAQKGQMQMAGSADTSTIRNVWNRIKGLHNPKTYLALSAIAGFRYDWCFRNPIYWFTVGFFIKWYRARYVFKIPVWDRQPNWNNIITSKEQEKNLRAVTCKTCGATLFIAKTREFFFEGSTGIGGLGCFSCGAKGADNFIENRDEILEDVAELDDYFEYEQPLDFVSRAERRKLLKETQGDENKANQILMQRAASTAETQPDAPSLAKPVTPPPADKVIDAVIAEEEEGGIDDASMDDSNRPEPQSNDDDEDLTPESTAPTVESSAPSAPLPAPLKTPSPPPPPPTSSKSKESTGDEDLNVLDMDNF